jgi:multiple sugar transport system ATP-binding protein
LDIADGELVVFAGPSGCGKSAVLNMIAGLEDISEGEIRIDGEVVNQLPARDRNIAMVFQSYALYPHRTVRQNMSVAARQVGMPQAEIDQRVAEVANTLGLIGHLDHKPPNLSGRQRLSVAIGRAIVRDARAVLMDDPLSSVDLTLRAQMRTVIARLQTDLKVTTLYAANDQTDAMTFGDRIVVLRFGRAQQVGTPQQLYELPVNLFVARYIGSPAMNFMAGRLDSAALQLPIGEVQLPARTLARLPPDGAGRDVVVGIRPEAFEDAALLEPARRQQGPVISLKSDMLEPVGSHVYAHFPLPRPDARPLAKVEQVIRELGTEDPPGAAEELVARLSRGTTARLGTTIELWFDVHKLHLFDPVSGLALSTVGVTS